MNSILPRLRHLDQARDKKFGAKKHNGGPEIDGGSGWHGTHEVWSNATNDPLGAFGCLDMTEEPEDAPGVAEEACGAAGLGRGSWSNVGCGGLVEGDLQLCVCYFQVAGNDGAYGSTDPTVLHAYEQSNIQ